jgi:hypothetical protein
MDGLQRHHGFGADGQPIHDARAAGVRVAAQSGWHEIRSSHNLCELAGWG